MEDLLRSKRMYRITLAKEQEHIDDENKVKCDNMNDEACGVIKMSISIDLSFHFQGINVPNKLEKA
jgi:hypothetical protein